jgi:glucose/arabinose dehydrogenase
MLRSTGPSHRQLSAGALLLAAILLASTGGLVSAGYTPGAIDLGFSRVASGLSRPVLLTHAGDGSQRRFIVEQDGRIRILTGSGVLLTTPFLDIRGRVRSPADGGGNTERGLLGLAFHPSYETNGLFYVNYTRQTTSSSTNGDTVIAEYHRSSTNADRASATERTVLVINQPYSNHNGGGIAFGPDGFLYIATGDGGSSGDPGDRAQNKSSLLGKILRINPRKTSSGRPYSVPSSNPFYGDVPGDSRIWSYGLRNPWRFSFDRTLGDLWIGDVGQNTWEEIDWSKASRTTGRNAGRGRNYGWDQWEGRHCFEDCPNPTTGYTFPVAEYSHTYGCSVTGGYVYRGTAYPDMQGAYIFGDYCSGRIWAVNSAGDGNQAEVLLRDTGYMISSFGEDERGRLYLTSWSSGEVFRLRDTTP